MTPGSDPGQEADGLAFVQARLKALQQAYDASLQEHLARLSRQWRRLRGPRPTQALKSSFYRAVHSLSGSGATFGHVALGDAARDLARFLETLPSGDGPFPPHALEPLEHLFGSLRLELRAIKASRSSSMHAEETAAGSSGVVS